jgi:hypothetical protein
MFSLRFRDKNGNYRWFETTGKRHFTAESERRALLFSRDITETPTATVCAKRFRPKTKSPFRGFSLHAMYREDDLR